MLLSQMEYLSTIRLVYNNETGLTENVPGVETRVEDFGNVTTLEYFFNIKAEQGKNDLWHNA